MFFAIELQPSRVDVSIDWQGILRSSEHVIRGRKIALRDKICLSACIRRRGRVDELRRPHTAARRGRLPPGPRESARVDDRVPEASRRRPVPPAVTYYH